MFIAGVAQLLERRSIGCRTSREAGEVERRPADAAAEHGRAVDDEAEAVAIGAAIDVDGAEPDAPEIDAFRRCRPSGDCSPHVVKRLRAMGVRPPASGRGTRSGCRQSVSPLRQRVQVRGAVPLADGQRSSSSIAAWPSGAGRDRASRCTRTDPSSPSSSARTSACSTSSGRRLEQDRAPGPDRRDRRTPGGMRPSSDVRCQRSAWCATSPVRHFGRGPDGDASSGASAWKRRTSSLSSAEACRATSTVCATNMLSECRMCRR